MNLLHTKLLLLLLVIRTPVMSPPTNNPPSNSAANPTNVSMNDTRFPCGTCDESVTWSQRGVACETCGQWFHLGCQDLELDSAEYENLGDNDISWRCIICANANYSTIAFDLHGIDSQNSTDLSFGSCISNPNAFQPFHASTPTRASKQDKHSRRPLRFLNVNCCSIVGKTVDFENLMNSVKPDVVVGTESWLNSKIKNSEVFPKGYTIFRKDRPDSRIGGGIFIAVSADLTSSEEPELQTECEILWIKIKIKGRRNLLVCCFYHPHTEYLDSMNNFLESARRASSCENAIIVMGGDFNLPGWDWSSKTLKKTSYPKIHHDFRDGVESLGFDQMVDKPTRGENFLDLFLTNQPNLVHRIENLPGLADHDCVYMEFQLNTPRRRQPRRQIPLYNEDCKVPLRAAASKLNEKIIDSYNLDSDVNTVWIEIRDGLLQACADHVPHKTSKSKTSLPWLDYEIKKMMRRRDRVHKRFKKSGCKDSEKEFLVLKRTIQRRSRQLYWRYVEGLVSDNPEADQKTHCTTKNANLNKKLYSFLNSRKSDGANVSPLKDAGKLITEPKEQAEVLNKQFHSVFSPKENLTEAEFETRCPKPQNQPEYPECEELEITESGVRKQLNNLNPYKAAGPDGLTPKLLQTVSEQIAPSITLLFQISLRSGKVPDDWKLAHVAPVFKKGERYKAVNYRPISLTCIVCKIMEHIVTSHIMSHCESCNILSEEQHGFRRGRSCETQLLGYVDEVSRQLEERSQVDTIVLDFSKAFDKVSHNLLLHKLHRYGIKGPVHSWIQSFLECRQQAVVVEGTKSSLLPVESGVPQGSVLGPSLFLLYINDLPLNLNSTTRLFADDTMCHNRVTCRNDQTVLQTDLNALATWEHQWSMEFHPQKCSTMSATKTDEKLDPAYSLHGHTLENVSTTKYLGITIQDNLKWENHITSTCNKANRTLGFLRRNLRIGNKKTKEKAYKSLVRPILEYASPVWDPYLNEEIQQLEKVQRRAARWVQHRHRQSSCVDSMLQDLKWPSLQLRRKKARLETFYKFHNNLITINSAYKPTPSKRRLSRRQNNSKFYDIPTCRTLYRQKTFFPRTIPEWNHLPEDVVAAETLDCFKSRLAAIIFN